MRIIHFDRIDHVEKERIGFYCGVHNLASFTKDEQNEFDDLMCELFGPSLCNYRDCRFFFTRYGLKKHKKLIRFLIRASKESTVTCERVWKKDFDIAYEDKEQVAILLGAKRKIRERPINIEKARRLVNRHVKK